ncbi:lipopolysaccharide biosynthesis protein [Flavobacterium tructae]|uniref:Wzz/FepE/Etk N-terminal domain-containing protein n=1 Tax=Flavobacterium tructae TaxID=1114873 RepID=UPI000B5B8D9F|nr:Wzz/FepE/Etk N-terminal domain-containing protein [Flavobacterium tructae]OXB22901.1 lipopolysaccharide biosynthesis protein [Flavobacterium tructae]
MENKSTENDQISLKELLEKISEWYNYLLSRWKIIIGIAFLGAVFGLTYSLIKKPIYTATLSFALEDEKSGGGGIGSALGLASSLGLDLGSGGGSIFVGSNLTELFKSRSMVEKTLLSPVKINNKVISLAEMYIQNNEWRKKWKDNSKLAKIEFLPNKDRKLFSRMHDSILGEIYGDLSKEALTVAQKDKKISIINIDVSSTNELFSKYFCEALAKEVGMFYVQSKSKKARLNMSILERQVDSIQGELNGAIRGVAVANDNTFMLNPALNVRRAPSVRRQVDVQANTAILTELIKQSELAKVTLRKETPLIQVIDKPILPLKREKFGKIKGIVFGGTIAFILVTIFLILRRILRNIML